MTATDHLEIGTNSFERCDGKIVLPPRERVRLILAAAAAYQPDLLVTAGHAVHSLKDLDRLADSHRRRHIDGHHHRGAQGRRRHRSRIACHVGRRR